MFVLIIITGVSFLALSNYQVDNSVEDSLQIVNKATTLNILEPNSIRNRESIEKILGEIKSTYVFPSILSNSTQNLPEISDLESDNLKGPQFTGIDVSDMLINNEPPTVFIHVPDLKIEEPVISGLDVVGNQIVDDGVPIQILGISVGEIGELTWRDLNEEYRKMSEDWHANCVRISVHPKFWQDDPSGSLQLIKNHIAIATSYDMYVIVDYHVIGWPDGYYEPAWGGIYISDFDIAMDFWSNVSREIEGENIMFELWNEPLYSDNETELSNDNHWLELKGLYEQMLNVIRSNDNNSIVLATGGSWSYDLRGIKDDLIDDPRVAYTWHAYAGNGNNDPDVWEIALDGLYDVKPVIVTEWGFEPDAYDKHWYGTAESYGYKFITMMEDNGLSSVAWNWNPYYGPPLTELDWITPTVLGEFVKDYYLFKY